MVTNDLKVDCVEICCGSSYSAIQAADGGAKRIELCGHLGIGGVSPSTISVSKVVKYTDLNVQVLVRVRAGHFHYTESELAEMIEEIHHYKSLHVSGIVTGALTSNGLVDRTANQRLLEAAYPLPVTFHRAFDETPDPREALEQIINLGFVRILTSGQQATLLNGMELVRELVVQANQRVTILAGAGINLDNIEEVIKSTKAPEIHFTARSPYNHHVPHGIFYDPATPLMETDREIVALAMRYQR